MDFLILKLAIICKLIKKKRKLDISIHIKEGKAVIVGEVDLHLKGDSINKHLIDKLKRDIPLKSYTRFRDESVLESEKMIRHRFTESGYPYVTLERSINLIQQNQTADILITIDPGIKCYFGEIEIIGDSLISRSIINKRIEIKRGDVYSQLHLDETQEELYDMALFRYVTTRAMLDSLINDEVPIIILMKELPRWSLKMGLGYGTEDKIRVSGLLTRLNFMGGARTLIVKAQHSYFVPINIETKFIQPDLWSRDLDLILNPFFLREREESYDVDRLGTALTLQKKITKTTAAYISYNLGIDNVDLTKSYGLILDDNPNISKNTKSGVTLGFKRNTTDNLFSPSKGLKFNGIINYSGIGFNSQFHFYRIIAEIAFFHPLGEHTVLAYKFKSGIMEPTQGDLKTPIEDRFLMGGALSLRGWGRNRISPIDSNGNKLGGNTMIENSAELRFPLYGIFSGTVFTDFGNVWQDSWTFSLKEMLLDTGVGLRIKSPIGPVRLDIASPMFQHKFNVQFFISIGHAF